MDYLWSIYYNGILSGPPTHFVNLFSNTAWLSLQPVHRAVTAGLDAALSNPIVGALVPRLKGRPRSAYFAEVLAMFHGAIVGPTTRAGESVGGLPVAFARMSHAFRTGEIPEVLHSKWQMEMHSALMAFSRWGERKGSNPMLRKWIARIIEAPSRALIVADVFFRSIAYDAQFEALRTREAIRRGVSKDEILPGLIGEKDWGELRADAVKFSGYTTFSDKPGKLTRAAYSMRELIPMGRAVIPFVNTLSKILTRSIEMTPVLGVVQRHMVKPELRDPALETAAKQIEGMIATMVLLTLFWDDDKFTGAPPRTKSERDAFYRMGKKPYAFKVGDTWIQYTRWLEPMSLTISNIMAFRDGLKQGDADMDMSERIVTVGWNVADTILQSSFADNLRRLTEGHEVGATKFLQRLPSTFVPFSSFWRVMQRTYEAHKEGGVALKEYNDFAAYMAENIPWWEDPPARIDAFGEEIMLAPDESNFVAALKQWLPFKWQKEESDFVETELDNMGVYPGLPGKHLVISGVAVEIPEDVWKDYAMVVGKDLKLAYAKAIQSPQYQRSAEPARLRMLNRIGERVRRPRREQLRAQLRRQIKEELRAARGVGQTRLSK